MKRAIAAYCRVRRSGGRKLSATAGSWGEKVFEAETELLDTRATTVLRHKLRNIDPAKAAHDTEGVLWRLACAYRLLPGWLPRRHTRDTL